MDGWMSRRALLNEHCHLSYAAYLQRACILLCTIASHNATSYMHS